MSPISLTMIFRIFYEVSKPFDFHRGGKTLMKIRVKIVLPADYLYGLFTLSFEALKVRNF